jgi:hypothetical protein
MRAEGLLKFHEDHLDEILVARGSSHNHQSWSGGYHDHLDQCFILAQDLFKLFHERVGPGSFPYQNVDGYNDNRPLPFDLESAIVVLYLHDIEKIFKYGLRPNRYPKRIVESKDSWYLGILPERYQIYLSEQEYNALKYIHGEGNDYKSDKRIASPLAGFCHAIDYLSARVFHSIRDISHGFTPAVPPISGK